MIDVAYVYADLEFYDILIFLKYTFAERYGRSSGEYFYGRPAYQMRTLYFCPVVSFYLSSFIFRLISAVTDWISTILRHMVWP